MSLPGFVRDVGGRFAKNLDPALRGRLDHWVADQSSTIRRMPDQEVAHLDHVEQAVSVTSHSSMASASTRSATRGRSPASVTTSTS